MIFPFNYNKELKLAEVGGKAKALIQTTNAGMPVPEGIVLSVLFFHEWLQDIKASEVWKVMLQDMSKDHCDKVKTLAEEKRFTRTQKQIFEEKLMALNGQVFAVRSSSPEEDLEGSSFAGMYETYLGVTTDQLESVIAQAFSSCFDYRVMEYKNKNDIDLGDTSIAIIVQKQIASDVSGVGFSLNPLNNCYDEVFINASFGLGEAIVSGIVTPDTYIIDSVKKKIIEKQVKEKSISLWLRDSGGIEEKVNDQPNKQALADHQILELSTLIKKCEKHYQMPMDIEWAFENGKLYLLQARPITTYIPLFPEMLTEPGQRKELYMDHIVITQGFQKPMSVLGLDLWGPTIEKLELGIFPIGLNGLMVNIHGRQYINISNMLKAMGSKITVTLLGEYNQSVKRTLEQIPLKDQYKAKKKTKLMNVSRKGLFRVAFMSLHGLFQAYKDVDAFSDKCNRINENTFNLLKKEVDKYFESCHSLEQTLDYSRNILFETMEDQKAMIAAMYALSKLKKIFDGDEITDEIGVLGMGLSNNPTDQMANAMKNLASHKEFKAIGSCDIYKEKIMNRDFSESFLEIYDRFIYVYGSRGFGEIDVANMRNAEDYESFYSQLKMIDTSGVKEERFSEKRQIAYEKLLNCARSKKKEKKFRKYADTYQKLFGYREWPKYLLTIYVESIRNIALSIGEKWVRERRLDNIQDVFSLHAKEIDLGLQDDGLDLRCLIEKNLHQYKRVEKVKQWPIIIDSRGKIFVEKRASEQGDLLGDGVSAGIVRGRAKVMSDPFEKNLEHGEILVTRATEPSWTPIFIKASGIVLEIGSTLQHGAIIAREYGLPCVCGIVNATLEIKDGDVIEVDGTNGIVKILESE